MCLLQRTILNFTEIVFLDMDDLAGLSIENLNIRYLVWKENPEPDKWVSVLHKKAGLPDKEAKAILTGSQLSKKNRDAIIEGFHIDGDIFSTARLFGLSSAEIQKENIKYLINSLPQGEKQKLAKAVKVTSESVSRWSSGKNPASHPKVQQLLQYFCLNSNMILSEAPLFLSLRPIGYYAQKEWLQKQVASLPADELTKLFPALEKMFGHYENR